MSISTTARSGGSGRRRAAALGLAAWAVLASGHCVYYNTFYRARRAYEDGMRAVAEAERRQQALRAGSSRAASAPPSGQTVPPGSGQAGSRGGKGTSASGGAPGIPGEAIQHFQTCIEKCAKVLTHYPNSKYADDALLLMGKALYAKGSSSDAVETLKKLEETHPESKLLPEALYVSALAQMELGAFEAAGTRFERLSREWPDNPWRWKVALQVGEARMRLQDYEGARRQFEEVARGAPEEGQREEALLKVAEAQVRLEQGEEAVANYRTLMAEAQSMDLRGRAAFGLADALRGLGRVEESAAVYREIIGRGLPMEEEVRAQMGLAEVLEQQERIDDALEAYATIARTYPKTEHAAEALLRQGIILLEERHDLRHAKSSLNRAYREAPSSPPGLRAKETSLDIALEEHCERILTEKDPERGPVAQFLVGEFLLLQLKDPESAREAYRKVVEDYSTSSWAPKAAYAAAWVSECALGDTATALEEFRSLIERFPETRYADRARERLGETVPARLREFYKDEFGEVDLLASLRIRRSDLVPSLTDTLPPAPADTARARPDTSGVAPVDTTGAPPDTGGTSP